MAQSVEEVLRATGWTDDEIKALDQSKREGLTRIVTSANEEREKAELALRSQREEYDKTIAPALASWADSDTKLSTENAALKTYLQKVKEGGYLPPEVVSAMPNFGASPTPTMTPGSPTRTTDGRFVASGTAPVVDTKKIEQEIGAAFSFAADTQWNYRQLYGQEMPDSPTALIREAAANRMSPSDWAAKKYNFAAKKAEIETAKTKAREDAIRKEEREAVLKEVSERTGNNPNVRTPQESAFSQINKATAEGKRKDPLKMTAEERKTNTHSNIQKEFAERSSMVN